MKINTWYIKNALYRLVTPSLWVQIGRRRCQEYDAEIRREMEAGTLIPDVNGMTAYLSDGSEIWTSNYPYAYGKMYFMGASSPQNAIGELTMSKLRDYLKDKQAKKEYLKYSEVQVWRDLYQNQLSWSEFCAEVFRLRNAGEIK